MGHHHPPLPNLHRIRIQFRGLLHHMLSSTYPRPNSRQHDFPLHRLREVRHRREMVIFRVLLLALETFWVEKTNGLVELESDSWRRPLL